MSQHEPVSQTGTGYCFDRYKPLDLFSSLVRAAEGFRYKDQWRTLQQRGMAEGFSWTKSAIEYEAIYKKITEGTP